MPFSRSQKVNKYQEGQTLLVHKPLEWTSFDVVNKIKYTLKHHFKLKKIKVGHAGTLDPLADGLLIVCTGKHTKRIPQIQNDLKVYTGVITIGATTPSYDLETEVENHQSFEGITKTQIEEVFASFLGEQEQMPPIFSAKKINGKRAYEMARKGKEVEMRPNSIHIYEFTLTDINSAELSFSVRCSKGTYIRSLANDVGQRLGCGAYLSALRRTEIGELSLDHAKSVDEIVQEIKA